MQSLTCFIVLAALATVACGAALGSSQQGVGQNLQQGLSEEGSLNAPLELARWKKSAYGGSPAPPCPLNYLLSCQPQVATAPCSQHSYAGAYSAPVPTYALPQARVIPQELIRRNLHW